MPARAPARAAASNGKKMDWEKVAEAIRARRDELRIPQDGLPGVSDATLYKLEHARQTAYKPFTLRAVEDALGWPHGMIEKIGRGLSQGATPSFDDRLAAIEQFVRDFRPVLVAMRDAASALR